jgi:hypothetical protein
MKVVTGSHLTFNITNEKNKQKIVTKKTENVKENFFFFFKIYKVYYYYLKKFR